MGQGTELTGVRRHSLHLNADAFRIAQINLRDAEGGEEDLPAAVGVGRAQRDAQITMGKVKAAAGPIVRH